MAGICRRNLTQNSRKASHPNEGQQKEEVEEHPLLTWTHFSPGDVVSFQEARTGQWVVGSVESKTPDELIIWIRDDLNDRRAFHFHDCESVQQLR
jgi:hypothetical protein